jgi:Zn finger protein HypA/HybF involved in hydrogenase expression
MGSGEWTKANGNMKSKKKWLPSIGLGSVLMLLAFLFFYIGNEKIASNLLVLFVCFILFAFLLRLITTLPESSNSRKPHDEFGWKNWQVVELPISCPECDSAIKVQDLDWIGPEAALCPSCRNQIDVHIDLMYKPDDKPPAEDTDSVLMVITGGMYGIIGIGLAAVLWSADGSSFYFAIGVAVTLIGLILITIGIRNESPYKDGKHHRQSWQVAEFPIDCPECGHPIEVHKLTWVATEEVHCPECSTKIDFDIAVVTGAR